jgi:small conductance mechanosensitive channel
MGYSRIKFMLRIFVTVALIVFGAGSGLLAQIPGLPFPIPPAGAASAHPKKAVASAEGPITVKDSVSDRTIEKFLNKFLPKYPGIRHVSVNVDEGVVSIDGRVDDNDSRDEVTDVVKRVQGVRVVMNQMSTDDEVMTAWQFATKEAGAVGDYLARKWLLIVVALITLVAFVSLARLFGAHSETVLAPFIRNPLLRSVCGSLISTFLVITGILLALGTLRLTQVVLSILGLSAVVGLAVGFAFRDITENFIASVLLGVRRPFQIGDYVTVAGQSGVVRSLNTRATVLVTLEGNHVRIPNSVIFKEIMVNSTASPSFRNSFDVTIPYEASTAAAIEAIAGGLHDLNGILPDPPPRALVDALEAGGVKLKVYFWSPTQGVDWFQVMSDAKLKAKAALQAAGVLSGSAADRAQEANGTAHGRGKPTERDESRADVARDDRKASSTDPTARAGDKAPLKRALEQPETRVSEEGTNLLADQGAPVGR